MRSSIMGKPIGPFQMAIVVGDPRFTAAKYCRVAIALFALFVLSQSGCTAFQGVRNYLQYNDAVNDAVLGWRNRVWARQAWNERRGQFACEPQFVTYGEGFRDGYADVAAGASGCVPALPPRRFWSWKYQTPEGQAKVAAWYAGYPEGARAAAEDGAGNFQDIQVSHWIEAQYSPEFQSGICPNCHGLPTYDEVPPGQPGDPNRRNDPLLERPNDDMSMVPRAPQDAFGSMPQLPPVSQVNFESPVRFPANVTPTRLPAISAPPMPIQAQMPNMPRPLQGTPMPSMPTSTPVNWATR